MSYSKDFNSMGTIVAAMAAAGTDTRIVVYTAGRDGARTANFGAGYSRPIWTGAIYEAKPRKADGVVTWRRVGSFGRSVSGNAPSEKFLRELREHASERGIPFVEPGAVSHGTKVDLDDLALATLAAIGRTKI